MEKVDLSEHLFAPACDMKGCENTAVYIAKGCRDKVPVMMCGPCFDRGIDLITKVVHLYQRVNKRVMICGDCHRPVLRIDTHLDVFKL